MLRNTTSSRFNELKLNQIIIAIRGIKDDLRAKTLKGVGTNNDLFRLNRLAVIESYLESIIDLERQDQLGAQHRLTETKIDILNNIVRSLCYQTSFYLFSRPVSMVSYDRHFSKLPCQKRIDFTREQLETLDHENLASVTTLITLNQKDYPFRPVI